MYFGSELDDDLFENPKVKISDSSVEYKPKKYTSEWFKQNSDVDCEIDRLKFHADYLYFNCKYSEAIKLYQEYLESLQISNMAGKRDCLEGISRSFLHQGKFEEAVVSALQLCSESYNNDQKIISWNLLAAIYHQMNRHSDELQILHSCLNYHPWNYDFWLRLAFCYSKMFGINLDDKIKLKLLNSPKLIKDKVNPKHFSDIVKREEKEKYIETEKETFLLLPTNVSEVKNEQLIDNIYQKISWPNYKDNHISCCVNEMSAADSTNKKGHLIVCACFIRAKVLLQTCILGYRSFAYDQNLYHQEQITSLIKAMNIEEKFVDRATQIYLRDIGVGMLEGDDTTCDLNKLKENTFAEEKGNSETFNYRQFEERWFKWIFKT